MSFQKITEQDSLYRHLDKMNVAEILTGINTEDEKVAAVIKEIIPQIEGLVTAIVEKMIMGGRLFYIGAGTSGRLGVLDASECPPTFGVPEGMINGIMAGGNVALTTAVEFAEDDIHQGWKDLQQYNINSNDVVIGVAASGMTPYVLGALQSCQAHSILTGSISCNPGSPLSEVSRYPIEIVTGPEFITGSTRMKAGTAQKMILNMISTAVMIQLGRVEDNKMVNMQLANEKLVERGIRMIMEKLNLPDYGKAKALLLSAGSVKKAIEENHS